MTVARPLSSGLPETVPARMVNEFVYCPRLFHLEWVQGRFATSDDVEEGRYVHRVVDEPGGVSSLTGFPTPWLTNFPTHRHRRSFCARASQGTASDAVTLRNPRLEPST